MERNIILSNHLKKIFNQNEDIQVVSVCREGDEVVEFLKTNPVDVVIMDFMQTNGLVTTAKIKKEFPTTRIIGFSSYDKGSFHDRMKELGAECCLSKYDTTINELIGEIKTVVKDSKSSFIKRDDIF